jgi:hypothetical protein
MQIKDFIMKDIKSPFAAVSPCVRLFIELMLEEDSSAMGSRGTVSGAFPSVGFKHEERSLELNARAARG